IASYSATGLTDTQRAALTLSGEIIGPRCEYSSTLTSRTSLHAVAPGPPSQLRASARILEPCLWEPQHPFCYEMKLELHSDSALLDSRRICFGIRHLAVERGSLRLSGQSLFLRGVRHTGATSAAELDAWHSAECSAWL